MTISFNTVTFTGEEKRHDAEKKVVTGGGAIAATAAATRTKAARSGFDMFSSAKKVSQGMQTVTDTAKSLKNTVRQTTTLWGKVCKNAEWAKISIIESGNRFKSSRFIKPLVESKVFRGFAGALGYGFGLVTLISGCSDIVKVATDVAQGNLLDK